MSASRYVTDAELEKRLDRSAHGHPSPASGDELRRWFWQEVDTRKALLDAIMAPLDVTDYEGRANRYDELRALAAQIRGTK